MKVKVVLNLGIAHIVASIMTIVERSYLSGKQRGLGLTNLLLTEFEVRTVSNKPIFFALGS